MKDYHDYLQEIGGDKRGCHWNEKGFASYVITGQECYIDNIYIKPKYRKGKGATQLADEIVEMAKEKGCNVLIGTVYTDRASGDILKDCENFTRSTKVLFGYGFHLLRCEDGKAVFIKEI